jgi:3-oxoacyl-[acyl-carrier-protein] synthase-3
MMQYAKISSTAHYVPEKQVTNDDLAQIMNTNDEWIRTRTGIASRHIAVTENTSELCTKVAKLLLEKAEIAASELDFVLVATMTSDYAMPSTASIVQGNIGAVNSFAFDLSAACSGFVYALSVADKLICSGVYRAGLVIGAEVISKILDWNDRSTASLFGDGAGGVLLTSSDQPCVLAEKLHADGTRSKLLTAGFFPLSSPYSSSEEVYDEAYLKMEGRGIFDFAIRDIPKNILEVLANAKISATEVNAYLLHQANIRIIEKIAKKLQIPTARFLLNIEEYGNTSAASIPILLSEAVEKGELVLGSRQKVVLTGFGGGLTWGTILLSL